jgi:hypothetical protein
LKSTRSLKTSRRICFAPKRTAAVMSLGLKKMLLLLWNLHDLTTVLKEVVAAALPSQRVTQVRNERSIHGALDTTKDKKQKFNIR